jgi:glycerophosphoryl diester phosphodiesterase
VSHADAPQLIGHRGARFEAPENTVPGFRYASGLAIDQVEFDVRLSRDGELVVIHDATVDRTTDGSGPVSDHTAAELARLDARSIFPDWPEPCGIPTLAEALDAIRPDLHLKIEVKQDDPAREETIIRGVVAELERRGAVDRATITSFDPGAVGLAARLAPHVSRGYIGRWDDDAFLAVAREHGCTHASISRADSSAAWVAAAREAGLVTTGWPCNEPEHLETLLGWGVDVICTDRPTTMLGLLGRRVALATATA